MKRVKRFKKGKGISRIRAAECTPYSALVLSVVSIVASLFCLVGMTFAWFTDLRTTYGSDIETAVVSVEVMHADEAEDDDDSLVKLSEITTEYPLFSFDESEFTADISDDEFTGYDLRKYIAVVNGGSLKTENNIGLTVDIDGDAENLGETIDVFYAFASEEDVINKPGGIGTEDDDLDFIYLGKLSDFSNNTQIYIDGPGTSDDPNPYYLDEFGNQTVRIKGILEPSIYGVEMRDDLTDTKSYYCIRLKFPKTAEDKYEGAGLKLNVKLEANNSINDLVNITTGTNNEALGLVLGGGTYYQKDDEEGGKAVLKTIPSKGYKFKAWTSTDMSDNTISDPVQDAEDINTWYIPLDADAKYIAEFVKESEFEETEEDNPFGDD